MKRSQGGFTLIEVMVAMVILASAAYILLGTHMGALNLFHSADTAVSTRGLLEQAIGESELRIINGELNGEEEFGPRYKGVIYKWQAELSATAGDQIPLYEVTVSVEGEDIQTSVFYYVYNVGISI